MCLGNICRSPDGARGRCAVVRGRGPRSWRIEVDSAGTADITWVSRPIRAAGAPRCGPRHRHRRLARAPGGAARISRASISFWPWTSRIYEALRALRPPGSRARRRAVPRICGRAGRRRSARSLLWERRRISSACSTSSSRPAAGLIARLTGACAIASRGCRRARSRRAG